ncbi:MAG: hypothetical protein R2850_08525 [Bacteroidia bacterium]
MRRLRETIRQILASPDFKQIRDRVKSLRYPLTQEQAERFMFLFLKWRIRYVSNRNFLIFLSVLVGIVCAIAAVILKSLVHYIENYLQNDLNFPFKGTLFFIFPIAGILLTVWFVKRFLSGHLGRGISPILFVIARKGSKVERHKTWSHLITSAITAGFGRDRQSTYCCFRISNWFQCGSGFSPQLQGTHTSCWAAEPQPE